MKRQAQNREQVFKNEGGLQGSKPIQETESFAPNDTSIGILNNLNFGEYTMEMKLFRT